MFFSLSLFFDEEDSVVCQLNWHTERFAAFFFSFTGMTLKMFLHGEMKVATNADLSINFAAHDCISSCAFNVIEF